MAVRKRILKIASAIEESLDDLVFSFNRRLGLSDPLHIIPYRTYGTSTMLTIRGRVLENKKIRTSSASDSWLDNLLAMYQRFESDEVRDAQLAVSIQGQDYRVTTDREGYFELRVELGKPIAATDMWYEIYVMLLAAPLPFEAGTRTTAEILIPPADAEYGIISDIDDTIVRTGATSLFAMSRNTFFHNAHTRLPFAGVAEFYRALQLGRNGKRNNPFFYVSSSPWNLYDLLVDFMDLNQIPEGPLLLRDFGLERNKAISTDHMGHKFEQISNVLRMYPHLNFVLIGDSGQEDPKIYKEVVREFPGRILAVYIRDVQLPEREKIALEVAGDLRHENVEMVIVDNSVEAANHAARAKLIYSDAIPQIIQDKKQDKGEIPGKEDLA